ncbi:MAG: hypothetical protein CSA07_03835 [Bacteroidia bacterium]|nr:MAG: hypothetical protein CSA07_03835 [Bacteroidia bacterium]
MVAEETRKQILEAIALIRPYLQNDGGDISLVDVTDDMVVSVRLHGSCDQCPFSAMTMKNGVRETIMRHVPGVKEVVALDGSND